MSLIKQTKDEELDNDYESYLNSDKYKKIKNCVFCSGCDYRCRAKNGHCPKWKNDRSWKKHRKNQIKKVA